MSYLAFDLGASSGRAMLGFLEDGKIRLEEVHRFETPIIEEGERLFWNIDQLWNDLQMGLRKALAISPDLKSLSVNSWAVDYVWLDAEGNALQNAYCYRDPIRSKVIETAFEQISRNQVYAQTGIQFLPFNTVYQLIADVQQSPELMAKADTMLMIADYFNYKFCGEKAVEVSNASSTQLMDVHTKQWAKDLLEAYHIPSEKLPKIVPSGTILGKAKLDGIETNVQVIAGLSHDTGAAVAAVPADPSTGKNDDWCYISCGTWSLLGIESPTPILTDEAREAGFTNEAGIDGTVRFLKNLTGLWALQECVREWKEEGQEVSYTELVEEARNAEANTDYLNLEAPEFMMRGNMVHKIRAYCVQNGMREPQTRGEITQLILQSIAFSYFKAVVELEKLIGKRLRTIHLVGGGSQNALLCEYTASECQKTVVTGPVEATALGNLAIQIRTMGDLPEGATVRRLVQYSSDLRVYHG